MMDLHHLPGADVGETEFHVFRRHWFTLLPLIFSLILILILPIAAFAALYVLAPSVFSNPIVLPLFVMGVSLFFVFSLLFLYQSFMDYWLDIFIVTDRRILDINQTGLFNRTVSELRLYRAQDVTAQIKGFWNSILDFGEIFVETAGEVERFHFESVPHPNAVTKMILEYAEKDRSDHLEEAVDELGVPKSMDKAKDAVAQKIEP